ncbi:TIGR04282 family arsenosugar biosynthesis glycosyltransferase [Sphingomonas sp.]|uniref:TIGR04282 family arsenosugar biosynthesis glycosyltransferase n=1 Tax=Sphingomonas sp. TaxID=28214 RepID=UPI0025D3E186|nr:TIGR04282 family arsenosugar biosynthesis glycosyltransferase [Sphingomonas sp.]
MATRIVILAKAPVPGRVKTRLIPALGGAGAARLAQRMLADTVAHALAAGLATPELCATPHPDDCAWAGHLPAGVRLADQGPGDLGQRLAAAAKRVIDGGERILLIGTDCPELDGKRLGEAAAHLESHDAMIHPARDGGYVLLGLARTDPSLFGDIAWSTDTVAATTIARIEALGWSLFVGDILSDVDEPADLDAQARIASVLT